MSPYHTARAGMWRSVIVILSAALLGSLLRVAVSRPRTDTVFAELAVVGGYRCVEPRLSIDAPYAPFRLVATVERKDAVRHAEPRLFSAAVAAKSLHEGLIDLLLGDGPKAVDTLARGDRGANAVDLAAAYYVRGVSSGSVNDFSRALHELGDAGHSPVTTFNRALILEQLSDPDAAAIEWKNYLALDASSSWAAEARQHLLAASRPSVAQAWAADEPRLIHGAAAGDVRRLRVLIGRYPLGARHLIELELLPQWGKAWTRGDALAAQRTLDGARRCVSILSEKGEHLLRDAIGEIDAAAPERKHDLAKAYAAYPQGHQALESGDNDRALAILDEALRLGGSCVAFRALVAPDVATALYRKYDKKGAQELIDQLRSSYRARSADYIALFARLDWLTGLNQVANGEVSQALVSYDRALTAYERLDESEYQAAQHLNIASALSYLGENDRVGVSLRKALTAASKGEDPNRLHGILNIAARTALDEGSPEAAVVFHDRLVALARATDNPQRLGDALVYRSVFLRRAGRRSAALRDLAEVDRLAPRVADVSSRQRLQADSASAAAFVLRDANDRAVIDNCTRAIDLFHRLGLRPLVAKLLLERGRAHVRLGEAARAESDFRAGIGELEDQRKRVVAAEQRISFFDSADRLFTDLALLLLQRGQTEEAFDLLERSRSRELLDRASGRPMTPMPVAQIRARLPLDTALVAYTVAGDMLVTWIVARDGVRAFEQQAGASRLASLVSAISAGFWPAGVLPKADLRRLSALLLHGVNAPEGGSIVFVPDPLLYRIPFAALQTAAGRYLVEEQTVVVAPSATLYLRNRDRDRMLARRGHPSLLAIASPEAPKGFDDLPPLTRTAGEAQEIAAYYARNRVIVASQKPAESLLAVASDYDAVHFAGHSVVDRSTPAHSALLIGESGRITAEEIESAPLSRLRLVVLGGCNTGIGKSHRSEGVMSLARAFMAASVPVVVGTVAPIQDDAAERLLTQFHRAYAGGLDPAAALRQAQLWMLRNSSWPDDANPARWSAFEVIGGAYAPQNKREEHRPWQTAASH